MVCEFGRQPLSHLEFLSSSLPFARATAPARRRRRLGLAASALALVLLVNERLQERREVRVEVARLGHAEVAVQQLLRGVREDRGDRGALNEELRA